MMSMIPMLAALLAYAFTFQSSIRDDSGQPIKGLTRATIDLRLHQTVDLSKTLWGRQIEVAVASNGLFTCELSDDVGKKLDSGVKPEYECLEDAVAAVSSGDLYAGFTLVDPPSKSSSEVRPRSRIMAVPLALQAQDSSRAVGDFALGGHRLRAEEVSVGGRVRITGEVTALRISGTAAAVVSGSISAGHLVANSNGAEFRQNVTVEGNLDAKTLNAGRLETETLRATTVSATGAIEIPSKAVPASCAKKGQIILWYGDASKVPAGWAICDGNGGRPNLKDRFVVGAGGSYQKGATGGATEVKLTVQEMPSHVHEVLDNQVGRHTWSLIDGAEGFTYRGNYAYANKSTESTGGGGAHPNLPPYYALYYLIKL